jgi:hypothetical protein
MKKLLTILAVGFAFALCAAPSFAAELYEDPNTGQLYTKPGDGRVPMTMPDEKAGALYEDPDTGTVFTKSAPGRVAVIETTPQASQAAQEPLNKDEVKAALPNWLQSIKIGGDLRLRYQYENRPDQSSIPRHRGRYRARIGLDAQVLKSLKLNIGLASGNSGDARSTNQTFDSFFAKKGIWFDYAYATFTPFDEIAIVGGRMKNPLYTPTDMLWDTDINPEGGAINVNYQLPLPVEVFANGAVFVLNESSSSKHDPLMFAIQPGVKVDITPKMFAKAAFTYYNFDNMKGVTSASTGGSGNTLSGGAFIYDYDSWVASAEFTVKDAVPGILPYASVFGEYIQSTKPDTNNTGYVAGAKVGKEKIAGLNDWSLRYTYRRLESDAWAQFLPDSDFFGGDTGVSGHEILLSYGILKNTYIDLDYYGTRTIRTNVDEQVLQFDLNFKF